MARNQRPQFLSWPIITSAARMAKLRLSSRGLVMAQVMPAAIAMGTNAAFSACRFGSPKEILDAPHTVLTPSSSRTRRTIANRAAPASFTAATGIASGSMITSLRGIPNDAARSTIFLRLQNAHLGHMRFRSRRSKSLSQPRRVRRPAEAPLATVPPHRSLS